ncbi:sugar epimerase [Pedobacter changchengzhani]|uniref:Sugar epimerase n=1 Tax=Pedobacter changchengzhani TaxID=2529274 RepID=A0A4R5MPH9_9SPHI|nr:WxcM-like domain-containing protein [Pedobacter changchengzhani]TDG37722.1 sugar epimerase [Pedobacter changchengzhani]
MNDVNIIHGGQLVDGRGKLTFINDFDMKEVRRFYTIEHYDVETQRGWRAHRIEQRWFHVCKGVFKVKLVRVDDWIKPNRKLTQTCYTLNAEQNEVLHISAGYAISLQALEGNSKMIVFADYGIEHAQNDDHLFPLDYFL